MSAATDAIEGLLKEHDETEHRGWIAERKHAAERAILLEALVRVREHEFGANLEAIHVPKRIVGRKLVDG